MAIGWIPRNFLIKALSLAAAGEAIQGGVDSFFAAGLRISPRGRCSIAFYKWLVVSLSSCRNCEPRHCRVFTATCVVRYSAEPGAYQGLDQLLRLLSC